MMVMITMMKTNKKEKECNNCSNLIPCGEGDHICLEADDARFVLDNYTPTKDYTWCKGKYWKGC